MFYAVTVLLLLKEFHFNINNMKTNLSQKEMDCLNQLFEAFAPISCKKQIEDIMCDYIPSNSFIELNELQRAKVICFFIKLINFFSATEQMK